MRRPSPWRSGARLALLLCASTAIARAQNVATKDGGGATIVVTIGNTTAFSTTDRPGDRNNGTEFSGQTSGQGTVPVQISMTTKPGVSNEDFYYDVTVAAGNGGTALLRETGRISRTGATKALSTVWDPSRIGNGMGVTVKVWGANPNRFAYFVQGNIALVPPTPTAASASRPGWFAHPGEYANCYADGRRAASFSGLTGQVSVRPDALPDAWVIAKIDMILCKEDHVKTDEDATAILAFADMSTFVLKPESEVVIVEPAQRSIHRVVAGNIWTNIKKMVKDGSMEIDMNQAVCGIKGTTLALSTSPQSSTVQVFEGSVEFRSKATGARALVHAGQSVTATARGLSPIVPFDVAGEAAKWRALGAPSVPALPVRATGAEAARGTGAPPAREAPDLSGLWTVTFQDGTVTSLTLRQSGSDVTGVLRPSDNSRGDVVGTFDGTTLRLRRDTGLETVQHYRVTVVGDRFSGTFENVGRYPDRGTFNGVRAALVPEPTPVNVTGTWRVTFAGTSESTRTFESTLRLRQSGRSVSGTMRAPDNSRGDVTGTFDGTTLVLSRDTGLETIQHYRVTVTGDRFTGTYVNEGRYPDSGRFAGVRQAP